MALEELIDMYKFEGEFKETLKEFIKFSYKEKIKYGHPKDTIEKFLHLSLATLEKVEDKTKVIWVNDTAAKPEVFTITFILKDGIDYKELISDKFSYYINSKIAKGNEFIFYTMIDQMALTPKFDAIEYTISLIGRFRYIK